MILNYFNCYHLKFFNFIIIVIYFIQNIRLHFIYLNLIIKVILIIIIIIIFIIINKEIHFLGFKFINLNYYFHYFSFHSFFTINFHFNLIFIIIKFHFNLIIKELFMIPLVIINFIIKKEVNHF